tara:strand:- start:343 stop:531 length:189 start_codon:yes stop_codon:yes gene_type:complete
MSLVRLQKHEILKKKKQQILSSLYDAESGLEDIDYNSSIEMLFFKQLIKSIEDDLTREIDLI